MTTDSISIGGKAVLLSGVWIEAVGVFYDLRWLVALILVLVVADFWFGLKASLRRGEDFRFSRAGRRTCNKFCDYIVYLIAGALFGLGIFEPLGLCTHTTSAALCMALGCVWEVDSIAEHVCELHGISTRFSVKRLIIAFIKAKSPAAAKAIEETFGKTESEKETPTN